MTNQPAQVPQCCGVCSTWWHSSVIMIGSKLRGCGNEACESYGRAMRYDDGTDCPCFERKEGE